MSVEAQLRPACEGLDDDTMFPEPGSEHYEADVAFAKSICAACPVLIRRKCLVWALANKEQHGVWGGASQEERSTLLTSLSEEVERTRGARKLVDDAQVAQMYAENPDPRAIAAKLQVNVRTVQRAVARTRGGFELVAA